MSSGSNFKKDLLKYSYINYDLGTMNFPGNISATSISAPYIYGNVNVNLSGTANLDIVGNVIGNSIATQYVQANTVTANVFTGNGSWLSGVVTSVSAKANIDIVGNATVPGNVVIGGKANVIGNVSATYFIGNGVFLSGILNVVPSSLNIDIQGNVVAPGNVQVVGQVTTSGNVVANTFIGNGASITNVLKTLPASANIDMIGNVTAPGNIVVQGQVNVSGNVSSASFIGNGSLLSGVTTSVPSSTSSDIVGNVTAPGNVTVAGQIYSQGNIVSSYILGNGTLLSGIVKAIPGIVNIDIVGNVVSPGNIVVQGQVRATGNVVANVFVGNGVLLQGVLTSVPTRGNIDITGNVVAPGNLYVQGQVYVAGNVIGSTTNSYLIGDGSRLTNLPWVTPATANVNLLGNVSAPGNIIVQGNLVSVGNISASYFTGNAAALQGVLLSIPSRANIDILGNVSSRGNVTVSNAMIVAGNVSGSFFYGNGSLLSGILTSLPSTAAISIVGNVNAPGNIVVLGQVNSSGNVTASSFFGNGVFLTSVVANLPSLGYIDIVGNVFAPGDVTIATDANITGNVTSPFFFGNGIFLSNVTPVLPQVVQADIFGNVTTVGGGNVVAYGQIRSVGNVVGITGTSYLVGNAIFLQNVPTPYPPVAQVNIIGNVNSSGNVVVGGQATVSGNVTGLFFIGNGALLTGISTAIPARVNVDIVGNVVSSGNLNVTGNVVASGNVNAFYFLGNGSFVTNVLNVFPTSASVDVFGNVLSGNYATFANIFVSTRGNISNVVVMGSNVTAGYFFGSGSLLTGLLTGIPSVANIDITGNIGGNVITTGNIRVVGDASVANNVTAGANVTASYFIGNGYNITFPGLFLIPYGSVANQAARLALTGVSPGTYLTQTDTGVQYILASLPASVDSNWLQLTIDSTAVTSVFGRTGAVVAQNNDYNSGLIQSSLIIGPIPSGSNVSNVLVYFNAQKANIVNGVVSSPFFFGDISAPGNVNATNVTTRRLSVSGNANVIGQVNVVGNVTGNYFFGNGLFLTGVTFPYPTQAVIDIIGNLRAPGNIFVAGQVNVVGNVTAPFLYSSTGLSGAIGSNTFSNIANVNLLTVQNPTIPSVLNGQVDVTTTLAVNPGTMFGNLVNTGGTTIGANLIGNVISFGNIDGNNVVSNTIVVYGNVFVSGNNVTRGMTLGGNLLVAGNVTINGIVLFQSPTLPVVPSSDTSNYTPLYINTVSNVVTTYPPQITRFANAYLQFGTTGLMFTYKNTLYASGPGFVNTSQRVYGQLANVIVPTPVVFPGAAQPFVVKTVIHNPDNAIVLTTDGRVFSWGWSTGSYVKYPTQLTFPGNPVIDRIFGPTKRSSSGGSTYVNFTYAAVSTTNTLYMWGYNDVGQLGSGSSGAGITISTNAVTPTALASLPVQKVFISQWDSPSVIALLANGQMYGWGMNRAGELGMAIGSGIITTPTIPTNMSAANVLDVSFAGLASSAVSNQSTRIILANGTTFAAGWNTNGCLGIGNTGINLSRPLFTRDITALSNVVAGGAIGTFYPAHYAILDTGNILFCGNTNTFGVYPTATAGVYGPPTNQPNLIQWIGDSTIGNLGTARFQGAMAPGRGRGPTITTPKVAYSTYDGAQDGRTGTYILDKTGNLYATGYNRLGNFGNGFLFPGSLGFTETWTLLNQNFPPGNAQVIDFMTLGQPNPSSLENGTIASLADGTVLVTGLNTYGSVPNTYVPNVGTTSTIVPFWTPIIGRLNNVNFN